MGCDRLPQAAHGKEEVDLWLHPTASALKTVAPGSGEPVTSEVVGFRSRCSITPWGGFAMQNWDSTGTHVVNSRNKNPRFTGVLEADEGTRTLDLLHGKQTL